MKSLFLILSLFFTQASIAAVSCKDFKESDDYQELRGGDVLTKENWKTIDVVLGFSS